MQLTTWFSSNTEKTAHFFSEIMKLDTDQFTLETGEKYYACRKKNSSKIISVILPITEQLKEKGVYPQSVEHLHVNSINTERSKMNSKEVEQLLELDINKELKVAYFKPTKGNFFGVTQYN